MKMLVSAISANNVIVENGEVPFMTADIAQYINNITKGANIVMGYNTWKIGRELRFKGRTNIILTRTPSKVRRQKGILVFTKPTDILKYANNSNVPTVVVGGAMTFASMGTYCDEVEVIRSDEEIHGGELTFFEDRVFSRLACKETENFSDGYEWELYYAA